MSAHAFLPPSGAAAWVECSVWPHMNARYPEAETSIKSAEGTAAHWVLQVLQQSGRAVPEGTLAPNGVAVTGEMIDGAQLAVDHIKVPPGAQVWVENRFSGTRVHPTLNWGTPDLAWLLWPKLQIYDYKFGHELVEAFENWQGINYAALIMDTLGIDGRTDQQLEVSITVIQPRAHHKDGAVRTWNVGPASNLRAYVNQLAGAAAKVTGEQPVAKVGSHCLYCPGRHACRTLEVVAQNSCDVAYGMAPVELSAHEAGLQLRFLERAAKALEARITGLKEQATSLAKGGQRVPFYTMESGPPRKVWTADHATVEAVGQAMGIPLTKPALITPLQAMEKGMSTEMVMQFARDVPGAAKLVPDDGSKARRAFGC